MQGRFALCAVLAATLMAGDTSAQSLVAARTIRAQTIITADDFSVTAASVPGVVGDVAGAIGMEARVAIYQGRPIREADIGPPALVERNQMVQLSYRRGALTISSEGRSLGRGGLGDAIRVMNIASRTTVTGVVAADGSVQVLAGH